MIYGKPQLKRVNDETDLIGLRTLILAKMWQPSRGDLSQEQLDKEQPDIPEVSGGVLLIGEQTRQNEGVMRTQWTFQGIKGDGKSVTFKDRENSIDYEFTPGFAQVSIQRHPNFTKLVTDYGGYPDSDGKSVLWPTIITIPNSSSGWSSSSNGQTNPMFGVQDFFSLEGVYRFRYASLTVPKRSLSSAGKIFTGGLPGETPELVEGRNWLSLPIIYKRRGLIYDCTELYWLSGRGGWPIPVYGMANNS